MILSIILSIVIASLLLSISFAFEQVAYTAILPNFALYGVSVGVLMAFVFNCAKIMLAWNIGSGASAGRVSAVFAKSIYVVLSLLASYLVFSHFADAPNLDKVLREHNAKVAQPYDARLQSGRSALDRDIAAIQDRYKNLRRSLWKDAQQRLDQLEKDRKKEMHITDSQGNFIGPRYKEIMRQIKETEQKRDARITTLNTEEQEKIAALREKWQSTEAAILAQRQQAVAKVTRESLRDDEAAQNGWLTAGPHLANRIFGLHLNHTHFALLLSVLATLAVELGPLALIVPVARAYGRNHHRPAEEASNAQPAVANHSANKPDNPTRPLHAIE